MTADVEVADSLASVPPSQWNALAGDHPALRHEFLHALHETGCACPDTGWDPCYLLVREGGALAGAMPLYLKSHSYGEYVFDWAWADAYRRHGLDYYPKLVAAVPFTPVPGPRLLAANDGHRALLARGALELARREGASSLHCLLPFPDELPVLESAGLMPRRGVQFHWRNAGYADFEAFLATLNHDRRKKIRQERRRVREAGIEFSWIAGGDVDAGLWSFFTRCYDDTYRRHLSTPYLNREFFARIGRDLPGNVVLFVARRGREPVAAALCLRSATRLYGRYWGAAEQHAGLHFEACYYQAIEYAIAHGLEAFEGGAQGEHKMARGLMPVETASAHWLAHPQFAAAVRDYLRRERTGMAEYIDELREHAPFRHETVAPPARNS